MALTSNQIERYYKDYKNQLWAVTQKYNPIPIKYAQCIYFWDNRLMRYTDMCSQFLNCNLGHGNKYVFDAIENQRSFLSSLSDSFSDTSQNEFKKNLLTVSPFNMNDILFTQTGREGLKCATELAQKFTKRKKIFVQPANPNYQLEFEKTERHKRSMITIPLKELTFGRSHYINFYVPHSETEQEQHLAMLREQIMYENPNNIAAIIVGCVHAESGRVITSRAYLEGVRALCNEFGIIFISDERGTAFGRCGKWFSVSNFNVKPDMIVFDNSVVSGYLPIGGVIINDTLTDFTHKRRYEYKTKFKPHALAYSAGIATIFEYEKNRILENTIDVSRIFKVLLEELKHTHMCVKDVNCSGLFGSIEITEDSNSKSIIAQSSLGYDGTIKKILTMLIKRGFYTHARNRRIIIAPPLVITEEQLKDEFAVLNEVLDIVDKTML